MESNPATQFGNVIAGKFGGKYSPQSYLAVAAQDPEIDGFIVVVSRRNPAKPYEFMLVGVESAEQLAYMKHIADESCRNLLDHQQAAPEPPQAA